MQGGGSGADAAASIYGGVLLYHPKTIQCTVLKKELPITLVYSGAKVKTAKVIEIVKNNQKKFPTQIESIFKKIATCVEEGQKALIQNDLECFGKLMDKHHIQQMALGVSTPVLNNLCETLNAQPEIVGAKISGAGLGDCVIGLGKSEMPDCIPAQVTSIGLEYDTAKNS